MHLVQKLLHRHRNPGDLVFAIFLLLTSLILLFFLAEETEWINGTSWFSQPRFWPAVSIFGMVIFAVFNLFALLNSTQKLSSKNEVFFWFRSLEYVCYFLFYVILVPIIGYFTATLLFAILVSIRSGNFTARKLFFAVVFSVLVVVLFRGVLDVKIPGGEIYNYLPLNIRTFALLYL